RAQGPQRATVGPAHVRRLSRPAIRAPMTRRLHVLSVSRNFPSPTDPSGGIFILNRVAAMARVADVHAIQPVPYFPSVTPLPEWAKAPGRTQQELEIEHAPMFYLPGVLKQLDAR